MDTERDQDQAEASRLAEFLDGIPTPLQVFGYFMGAVSVLNILSDVLQLQSDIFLWVRSYRRLVERTGEFLFGWIDFWSFEITTLELHVLVLALLVSRAAYSRQAVWPYIRSTSGRRSQIQLLGLKIFYRVLFSIGTPFVLLVLLPSPVSVVLVVGQLAAWSVSLLAPNIELAYSDQALVSWEGRRMWWFNPAVAGVVRLRIRAERRAWGRSQERRRLQETFLVLWSSIKELSAQPRRQFLRHLTSTLAMLAALIIVDQLWLQALQ